MNEARAAFNTLYDEHRLFDKTAEQQLGEVRAFIDGDGVATLTILTPMGLFSVYAVKPMKNVFKSRGGTDPISSIFVRHLPVSSDELLMFFGDPAKPKAERSTLSTKIQEILDFDTASYLAMVESKSLHQPTLLSRSVGVSAAEDGRWSSYLGAAISAAPFSVDGDRFIQSVPYEDDLSYDTFDFRDCQPLTVMPGERLQCTFTGSADMLITGTQLGNVYLFQYETRKALPGVTPSADDGLSVSQPAAHHFDHPILRYLLPCTVFGLSRHHLLRAIGSWDRYDKNISTIVDAVLDTVQQVKAGTYVAEGSHTGKDQQHAA